jgi:hypothetical protein
VLVFAQVLAGLEQLWQPLLKLGTTH